MKVYITKYALTKGILIKDAEDRYEGMIRIKRSSCFYTQYFNVPDWHKTKKAAIKQANEMKKKKIASLKKQLNRIQALTFEPGIESK